MSRGIIQNERSADLVTHKIFLDGSEIPASVQVKDVVVHKEINRIPYAKVTFLDGDPADRDFPLSNQDQYLPGKTVEILVGYHSSEERIFLGLVVSHRLSIKNGQARLILECRDAATKMTVKRRSGYFYDLTDAELIETLATRNGLEAEVASTSITHKQITQYQVTDWDLLVTRAQVNGMVCKAEDGKITVAPPDLSQDSLEVAVFGANILDFDAAMDGRDQFQKVSAYGWDKVAQEITIVDGENPSLELGGNVRPDDLAGLLGTDLLELRHGGVISGASLQEWVNAKWLFQQLAKIRGRVRFQGTPRLFPGGMITLEELGDRFSGKVFISGLIHNVTEGNWTVDVQIGISPSWFTENYDIHPPVASGLFSACRGLQVGVVTQLEDDPEGEDRIMVKIPIVNGEEQGIWCRLSNMDAGEERGTFFRPEIGDEVVLGFINEDPNQVVVLGMLHSSAKPSPEKAADDNHRKGYVSRSGISMVFDDESKSLTIQTPEGKTLTLNEEEDVIEVEDNHGNKILMDGDGITLESAKDLLLKAGGDVTIEGMDIHLKAQSQFKAEGSGGAEVSTSAVAVLKGSLVQIN
ncbi:type VI secretion system tip protein VgrG [Pleomorphovibrio marinus]|uniref:type VI secretion system tip protein VgrG n=1 Tax=Pleomorphovibrio marinus TaxID=2164132 RepID=UPI000E0C8F8C|nr:type VI secretion system tip protein VgrG [Pleomorphovibrio marinus]